MNPEAVSSRDQRLAESIREACVEAALRAYEDAGISGLCAEGRWEMAVQGIRTLDIARLLIEIEAGTDSD